MAIYRKLILLTMLPILTFGPPENAQVPILTFDDCGRSAQLLEEFIDAIPKDYKILFFPTGQCRLDYPAQINKMSAIAPVCNHTFSHPHLPQLSYNQMNWEIRYGVNINCRLWRPPFGESNETIDSFANQLGLTKQMWDVDSLDWAGASVGDILHAILKGGVILLHLWAPNTLIALRILASR